MAALAILVVFASSSVVISNAPCGGGCAFARLDGRRIAAADLESFKRPVVLTGLTSEWPARRQWPTAKEFELLHGEKPGFARDHDQLEIRDWDATVSGYIKGVSNVTGAAKLPASAAFFINDFEDSRLLDSLRNDYLLPDALHQIEGLRVFSLERPGAGVALHHHEQAWQAQLAGSKAWYLVGPEVEDVPQGRPCNFADEDETPPMAECCVVHDGEIMYFPNGWWHATCSLPPEPSIAIGGIGSLQNWPLMHVASRRSNVTALKELTTAASATFMDAPKFPKGLGILQGGDEPLVAAVAFGHHAATSLLLEKRANPNTNRFQGGTVLHEAARRGDVQLLRLLHEGRADLTALDSSGSSVLHSACRGRGSPELVQYLLGHGLKAGARRHEDDRTPMHDACVGHPDPVAKLRLLLGTSETSPSPKDRKGVTPLALCAAMGHARGVGLLLKLGGQDASRMADVEGRTVLDHAFVGRGDSGVLKRLLDAGFSPVERHVQAAARMGETETLRLLLAANAPSSGSILEAARAGHAGSIRELIGHASYDEQSPDDKATPLHQAALAGHVSVVRALLAGRATVTADGEGLLPLHYAAMSLGRARLARQQEVLEVLTKDDESWLKTDKRGATALHFAAAMGDAQLARWLALERAVIGPCLRDNQGNTASELAAQLNHSALSADLKDWCDTRGAEL